MATPSKLTREELTKFLPNQRAIRAFEQLLDQVSTEIPAQINIIIANTEALESDISTLNANLTVLSSTVNDMQSTILEIQSLIYGLESFNLAPLLKRLDNIEKHLVI